jgi:hypothetical protein
VQDATKAMIQAISTHQISMFGEIHEEPYPQEADLLGTELL